jgi:hypothetical protein
MKLSKRIKKSCLTFSANQSSGFSCHHLTTRRGSATMEYVIVSTFAALISIAAITFVGRMVKSKVSLMAEKIGMTPDEFEFDLSLDP